FSLHDDLEWLVKAGLSPLAALQAATRNPAVYLERLQDFGTVEKGKIADLVLLDADPLQDIRNTRRIAAVVSGGKFFSRADLDRMLADIERLAGAH
ncbi:MAG TPA: amidohydrolase family protein, partial [Burkholderiales bacterium]|nr:amidohydrolase family protein [Burkholderiales bacterium]